MTDSSSYPDGTPIWTDLATPDVPAAVDFYRTVFGWEPVDLGPDAGGYMMFTKDGKTVAGIGPLQPGAPTAWSTYIKTGDASEIQRRVEAAGGTTIVPRFEVLKSGAMAVFVDNGGAVFSVWEPKEMQGADLFNAPGAVSWNELATRDLEGAKTFYNQVFGWDNDHGEQYIQWMREGRPLGGAMPMDGVYPAEVPPHWLVYFGVENCQEALDRVRNGGGEVMTPPQTIPFGTFSVVRDPAGASFAVFQAAEAMPGA